MRFWQAIVIAVIAWAAIYLPGLGTPELKGEEGRRILPGIRMIETGDWIVPEMEGQPYLRKPPLINWAIAASILATHRHDEWAARLPSALSVLAMALAGLWACRGLVAGDQATDSAKNKAGLVVALVLLANAGMIEKGRLAEIEALYTALTGMAFATWLYFWRAEASPWFSYVVPWFWLGLGWVCKGPVHLIFFYAIVVATLWKDRSLRDLRHPAHFAGLLVMAGVGLPWYFLAKRRVAALDPDANAGATWLNQLTHRLGFDEFSLKSWLMSPLETLLQMAPWIFLLLLLWRRLPRLADTLGGRDRSLVLGLRLGTLVTTVLLLLVPETRARFLQPLTFPAAVLCALVIWHEIPAAWAKGWERLNLAALALLTLAAAALPWVLPGLRESAYNAGVCTLGGLFAALALWRVRLKIHRLTGPLKWMLGSVFAVALASAVNAITLIPWLRTMDNCRPVGAALTETIGRHDPLYIVNPGKMPTPLHWRFYLGMPHTVVAKAYEIPDEVQWALAEEETLNPEGLNGRRLVAAGFTKRVRELTDNDGRHLVLLRRVASDPDGAPDTEPSPPDKAPEPRSPSIRLTPGR